MVFNRPQGKSIRVDMKKQNIVIAAVVSVLVLLIAGSGGYLLFRHLNVQQSDERMESAKS